MNGDPRWLPVVDITGSLMHHLRKRHLAPGVCAKIKYNKKYRRENRKKAKNM